MIWFQNFCKEQQVDDILVSIHELNVIVFLNSTLGGSHGVPKVHYKGRQGDYYVMV